MRPFVAVDVETSGLDPRVHELIEVGLVFEEDAGTEQVTFSLPFEPELASVDALRINGWDRRGSRTEFPDRMESVAAAELLHERLHDVHLVGKNPTFDAAFLAAFIDSEIGAPPPWHHRLVDVGALAWGWYCAGPEKWTQPPNVAKVAEMMGIPIYDEVRHTALGDAAWAYRVFRTIVPQGV